MRGSIRERSKGYWEVSVSLGRDPVTGRQRRRYAHVRGPKRDAERLLTEMQRQVDTGIDINPERLTVADYLDRWLRDYAATNVRPSTYARYAGIIRNHIVPHVGSRPLARLRPAHVQSLVSHWQALGLSSRTVIRHHMVLHQALKHAVEWQLIATNPAAAAKTPREQRTEARILSPGEIRALLTIVDAEPPPWPVLVRFALATGMRRGELGALRWQDVDWERRMLHVTRTVVYLPGAGPHLAETKTARGRRPIPLASDTIALLRAHRIAQAGQRLRYGPRWEEHDLVFPSRNGRPAIPNNLYRRWRAIAARAGIADAPFHSLRHTCGSMLAAAGVNPRAIADQLGHTDVTFTLNTYVHTGDDTARTAVELLAQRLRDAAK